MLDVEPVQSTHWLLVARILRFYILFLRKFLSRIRCMPDSVSRGLDIDPVCVSCGSLMRFSCVEPATNKPGFVHKVYECVKCRSAQSFVTSK